RRGLGEGRHKDALSQPPILSELGRTALKCLVRRVSGECDGDVVEPGLIRDLCPGNGEDQIRGGHQATRQVPAALRTKTLTILTPSPEEAVARSVPLMVTWMLVSAS